MLPRPVMIATLLGASIGVPYAVTHTGIKPGGQSAGRTASLNSTNAYASVSAPPASWTGGSISQGGPGSPLSGGIMPTSIGDAIANQGPAPPQVARLHPVETVLRFDLTRDWVYQNWDRKSTWPTEFGLSAVRVALVSGTEVASLAGALTYYFNANGQIEHISFHGRTGDAARLIGFMQRTYLFAPAAAPTGEQLYQVAQGSRVQSELRIRPEPVTRIASPHGNVLVELELARPGSSRFLPPRVPQFQLPPAAASSQPAPAHPSTNKSNVETAVDSYFDKARYATPQEKGQVMRTRWPN
jgi:hypothetical protein